MAGSRAEKIGSIFSRVTGLLRSGALKESEKPIWYEVYAAYPPQEEPRYEREHNGHTPVNILYKEDFIRARFYSTFVSEDVIDMTDNTELSLSQRFIHTYQTLEQQGAVPTDSLFDHTTALLKQEGFQLKTHEELLQEREERKKVAEEERIKRQKAIEDKTPLIMTDILHDTDEDTLDERVINDTER